MDSSDKVFEYSSVAVEDGIFAPDTASVPKSAFASKSGSAPPQWSPLARLGFRVAFIYFCCFLWLYGNDGILIRTSGSSGWLSVIVTWPMDHLAVWAGHHIFHLAGIPPHWHVTHRGDTMINWVLDRLFAVAALVGGLVWTAIAMLRGSRRTEYRTLHAWLRFLLRLAAAFFMTGYGMVKVFPLQMPPISIDVLSQTVGQISPESLLWSAIALHPLYESICGMTEVIAGTLLLFRRTALAGALLSVFLMINVVLYNFFFDVSVKLFALNLLLVVIFLVLPDVKPLFDFFWLHQPAVPAGPWSPPETRPWVRSYVRTLEIVFIVTSLFFIPVCNWAIWTRERTLALIQSPLLGAWHFDSTHPAAEPFLTPKGPATDFYVDTVDRAFRRTSDGGLWTTYLWVNPSAHTVFIRGFFRDPVTYGWRMPDANHLILTTLSPNRPTPGPKATPNSKSEPAFTPSVVTLTRIPTAAHYPLLEHRFHFLMQGSR